MNLSHSPSPSLRSNPTSRRSVTKGFASGRPLRHSFQIGWHCEPEASDTYWLRYPFSSVISWNSALSHSKNRTCDKPAWLLPNMACHWIEANRCPDFHHLRDQYSPTPVTSSIFSTQTATDKAENPALTAPWILLVTSMNMEKTSIYRWYFPPPWKPSSYWEF